jgi:hypothetical protein
MLAAFARDVELDTLTVEQDDDFSGQREAMPPTAVGELIRGGAAPADPLADSKLASMKSLAYSVSPTARKRLQGFEQDRKVDLMAKSASGDEVSVQ